MISPEAAAIRRHQAALCERWAEESVEEASLLHREAPAVARRRIEEGEAWAACARAHTIVLAGEGGSAAFTRQADASGIMRGMNPSTLSRSTVLLLVPCFAALLLASCHTEPAICPLVPFQGPFTCQVQPQDEALPCLTCIKTTCCAEFQACEEATCGCLLGCRTQKKRSQEQCAARCPVPSTPTYTRLSKCLDGPCAVCPAEHG